MKKTISLFMLLGAMLLSSTLFGQNKYQYKNRNDSKEKATFHLNPPINTNSRTKYNHNEDLNNSRSRPSTIPKLDKNDPPFVNDAIDVYSVNPELLKATLTVHLGHVSQLPPSLTVQLYSDPYYDFKTNSYFILVSAPQFNNIHGDTVYNFTLFEKSTNKCPTPVTYRDFVTKWNDPSKQIRLNWSSWASRKGGSIEMQWLNAINITVTRVVLVLQFKGGTKTIVWNTPANFDGDTHAAYQFNQNFEPMN